MRARLVSVSAGLVVMLGRSPDLVAAAATCPASGETRAVVAAVEPRLELRLADGRLLRLVGLDPALQTPLDPDGADTARARLAALIEKHDATVHLLSDTPDRWGRLPAQVFVDDPVSRDVAATAIALGLGRYLAEPAARACRDALVAAEGKARDSKLGLWADPYYAVLAVDDRAGFTERSGTIVLVQGRLAAILPGPYRTKLRFAARDQAAYGSRTLNAVILPRQMKTFETQRVDFKALIGRTLRLRGLLDQRFGPQIELSGPDEVEVLDAADSGVAP